MSITYRVKYKCSNKDINSVVSSMEGEDVKIFTREEVKVRLSREPETMENLEKGLTIAMGNSGYDVFDFEFSKIIK